MKPVSTRKIKFNIVGNTGIENTLKFNGKNYVYKTKGGRFYMFITELGERRRISEEKYNEF